MPKVSVIIPVYNSGESLIECLGNLVNQTIDDIELIIVNDCSTDNSLAIMLACEKKYPDKVLIINSDVNRGPGGAKNIGLSYATGEYIGFVDSDDIVDTDMYNKLYKKAKEDDYDIVDCGYYSEKEEVAKVLTSDELTGIIDAKKRNELVAGAGYFWSKLFKRSFLESIELKFRENCILEDCETLMYVFAKANSIGNIKEILYRYKYSEKSMSNGLEVHKRFVDVTNTINAINEKILTLANYSDIQEGVEYVLINLCIVYVKDYMVGKKNNKRLNKSLYIEKITNCMNNMVKIQLENNRFVKDRIKKEDLEMLKEFMQDK